MNQWSVSYQVLASFSGHHGPESEEEALAAVFHKIDAFGGLQEGWDFGQGGAVPVDVRNVAKSLVALGSTLRVPLDVFPGSNREIAIAFYKGDLCLEIIACADGTFDIHLEEGTGFHYEQRGLEEGVELGRVRRALYEFAGSVEWTSPEYFTLSISIPAAIALRVPYSGGAVSLAPPALMVGVESPYSKPDAPVQLWKDSASASTFTNTMQPLFQSHASSGRSIAPF